MIKVVVADRGRADIYETPFYGEPLTRLKSLTNPLAYQHERALVSDAPGRSFNRASGAHQSYGERHSLRDQATVRFAREIADAMTDEARSADCAGLVLVGSPRLLAQLNSVMPRALKAKLLGKIPKDLAHRAPRVISAYLKSAQRNRDFEASPRS